MKYKEGQKVIFWTDNEYYTPFIHTKSTKSTNALIKGEPYSIGGYSPKPFSDYKKGHYYWLIDKEGYQTPWCREEYLIASRKMKLEKLNEKTSL